MNKYLWIVILSFAVISCSRQNSDEPAKLIEKQAASQSPNAKEKINPAIYQLMMKELMTSLKNWNEILPAYKRIAVQTVIELFKTREKAMIRKSAEFYAASVSQFLKQTPDFSQGLPTAVKILAVMEYDFDNGQDKDVLAKTILGEETYNNLKSTRQTAAGGVAAEEPIVS